MGMMLVRQLDHASAGTCGAGADDGRIMRQLQRAAVPWSLGLDASRDTQLIRSAKCRTLQPMVEGS